MSSRSNKEIYRRTSVEFRSTLRNLIDSHSELNQRAIDLAKINILSVSVFASGIAIVGMPEYYLLFSFGVGTMILSVAYCIHVYRPRDMHLGLGPPDALENIQDAVDDGISEAEYYRKLCIDLNTAIQSTDGQYKAEVRSFRNGLWTAVGGILFFAAGLVQLVVTPFTSGAEYLLIFLISILVLGARGLYEER